MKGLDKAKLFLLVSVARGSLALAFAKRVLVLCSNDDAKKLTMTLHCNGR